MDRKYKILNELAREYYQIAIKKGWWGEERTFGDAIALMHSELSEALEDWRQGASINKFSKSHPSGDNYISPPKGIPIELADCIIRILDFCGRHGVDIGAAMEEKMKYNITRPYRHGGKVI